MDATTLVVAGMGFVATVSAAVLGPLWQGRGNRRLSMLEAKVRAFGDCTSSLYEYERATYNRVNARIDRRPDRENLRQEAWRSNAAARATIGQAAILAGSDSLYDELEEIRHAIGDLNTSNTRDDLKSRRDGLEEKLERVLDRMHSELAGK